MEISNGNTLRVRVSGLNDGASLMKTTPSSQEYRDLQSNLEPDVAYGQGANRTHPSPPARKKNQAVRRAPGLGCCHPIYGGGRENQTKRGTRSPVIRRKFVRPCPWNRKGKRERIPKGGGWYSEGGARCGTHLGIVGLAPQRPREFTSEIIERPVGAPRAVLRVPSSPSSQTRRSVVKVETLLVRVPCFRCRQHHERKPV